LHGDCLELMKGIPDKSVDLVVIDPPYNIKIAKWDSWKNINEYVSFMGKVFLELQRVLKENGSFYFFHNDFIQICELQNWINKNTNFKFNSFIIWDKKDFRPLSWKNPSSNSKLRSWFNTCEYCLYYTFQDSTGLEMIDKKYVIPRNPFRKAIIAARKESGLSVNEVAEKGNFYGNVNHGGSVSNWENGNNIPTKEQYEVLKTIIPLRQEYESLRQEYESLRQEYESLRQEYESLRYTHNLDKEHKNVWTSDYRNNGKYHCCQKPIDILERIIKVSSNKNDVILDCFMGSGSTGVACVNTNRNFIGIELDDKYFEIAKNRIEEAEKQKKYSLF